MTDLAHSPPPFLLPSSRQVQAQALRILALEKRLNLLASSGGDSPAEKAYAASQHGGEGGDGTTKADTAADDGGAAS